MDTNKQKLLSYIQKEWKLFLYDYKRIKPKSVSKEGKTNSEWKNEEAKYNQEANAIVRQRIAELKILWSNPGDIIVTEDGFEVILEGVDNNMDDSIYKEYKDARKHLELSR